VQVETLSSIYEAVRNGLLEFFGFGVSGGGYHENPSEGKII
jgi:hypothetical protein